MSRILIVDDKEASRRLLQTTLTAAGHKTREAANGAEALDLARRERPDLIVSDAFLPQMDGFALCRECKRDETLRGIPFVFYAAQSDPRDRDFGLRLGAARFIVKPAAAEEFSAIVKEVLEQYARGKSSPPPVEDEAAFYRLYNETLARNLEGKISALEKELAKRKQTEQILRRRDAILSAVSYAAEKFLQAPISSEPIQDVLAMLGWASRASRVYIFEGSRETDRTVVSQRYEWSARYIAPQIANPDLQRFSLRESGFGRWEERLSNKQALYGNIKDFPEGERAVLAAQDILSIAVVPIFAGSEWWGFLGFDDCAAEREWSSAELDALQAAAEMLGSAFHRLRVEAALIQSETRYRSLIDQLPAMMYLDDLRVSPPATLFISPRVRDILGYPSEEWQAGGFDLWKRHLHPDDRERAARHYLNCVESGSDYFQEYRMIARDGRVVWLRDHARIERDENGTPIAMQGAAYDITASKNNEERILEQLAHITALREIDQIIISSFDLQFSLNSILARTVELLKTDAASALLLNPVNNMLEYAAGRGFRTRAPESARIKIGESYAGRAVQERKSIQIPNLADDPENKFRTGFLKDEGFVGYYGIPLIVKGQALGVLEVFHRSFVEHSQEWLDLFDTLAEQAAIAVDNAQLFSALQRELGERRLAEEKLRALNAELEKRIEERTADLRQLNNELERALRIKDEFLANMSHELRTPLNAIIGLSESLAEQTVGALNEKQEKYVGAIGESGQHLLHLINDILDLARIEAGQAALDRNKVDIEAVCRSSLRMIKQLAHNRKQEMQFEMDADLGRIWADERRLKQMIINLLSNAVKFTPEGGKLGLQARGDRNNNSIQLTVWDTGIGIAEEDLPRLFKPFTQLDLRLARKSNGSGLGLALVAKMAALHGGSVSVESQPGKGSRFTLNLPWESALTTGSLTGRDLPDPGPSAPTAKEQTILIVDDTEEVILLFKDYLEYAGYKAAVARNGMEGIVMAESLHPSLILMDVQMPMMDGIEAARRIRKIPGLERAPIIALTALAMKGDRERCLAAGMNDYLSKPVTLKTLLEMIQNHLSANAETPRA